VAANLGLVLDCADPEPPAEFWAAALGYTTLGSYVMLVDEAGAQPKLLLQRGPEAKTVKNRMHFDIECLDVHGEASRPERLGAVRVDGPVSEHGSTWVVMNDPEGNEFCVRDGGQPG
jgi:predicted enzyme related to lactoylglutathione lyase